MGSAARRGEQRPVRRTANGGGGGYRVARIWFRGWRGGVLPYFLYNIARAIGRSRPPGRSSPPVANGRGHRRMKRRPPGSLAVSIAIHLALLLVVAHMAVKVPAALRGSASPPR